MMPERRFLRAPVRTAMFLLLLAAASAVAGGCGDSRPKIEVLPVAADNVPTIKMACSDETIFVLQKLIEGANLPVRFDIYPTQSGNVLELLSKKSVELGVTSRVLAGDPRLANLNYVPYALDGAVFMASEDAGVRSLNLAQLRSILEGKIRNWKEVGGADREIQIIGRPPNSSVAIALGNALFGGKFPTSGKNYRMETSEGAYQAMKTLKSFLAYAPMSRIMIEHLPAIPLAIEGMPPLLSNVPFRKYPGKIEHGLLFAKDAPEAVKELANFLVSVEGLHQVSAAGLAPASSVLPLSSCHCRATEGTFPPSGKSALAGIFTIAVVPELGAIEQERRYAPLLKLIAEQFGIKTRLRHLESYGRVVTEFAEGRIDAAFVGSYVYAQLHTQMGVVPIARPVIRGIAHYRGIVIVRADSGMHRFQDLRGRSFAYVQSTSAGELFTTALAARTGESPSSFFSRVVKVFTHAEAISLVETGKVDGAAVKDTIFERVVSSSPRQRATFLAIENSPSFPENSLVVGLSVDEASRKKLREILVGCDKSEAGKKALNALGAERFVTTSNEDYAKLYALAKETGLSFGKK